MSKKLPARIYIGSESPFAHSSETRAWNCRMRQNETAYVREDILSRAIGALKEITFRANLADEDEWIEKQALEVIADFEEDE